MKMRVILFFLIFILAGGGNAIAHGGDPMVPSTDHLNGQTGSPAEGLNKDNNQTMAGMNMGEGSHSHQPVQETPPNKTILGAFGMVNLIFICIGVWNKWFRKKGGCVVNSN
ncbi:hypothetical protein ACQYAD_08055 [Neobacillus sp. SM06]|uniref:hypothetical protein n=1 Tax=Neobacillus sp. SM06 TaxID=3422492 RepID=UPI003D2BB3A8